MNLSPKPATGIKPYSLGLSFVDVIEFYGPACGGKSSILYSLIPKTILPRIWVRDGGTLYDEEKQFYIGGADNGIILIDLDGRFDMRRVYRLIVANLRKKIQEFICEDTKERERTNDDYNSRTNMGSSMPIDMHYYDWLPTEEEISQIACLALQRVHVFQPNSSLEFLATLQSLPEYMLENDDEFKYLMIDSIMAFYWQDKSEEMGNGGNAATSLSYASSVVRALRQVIKESSVVTITTNWALTLPEFNNGINETMSNNPIITTTSLPFPSELFYRDISPRVWQEFVKYRFVVAKQPLPQYPVSIHPTKVVCDQARMEILRNTWFSGRIVTPICGNINLNIFTFKITEEDGILSE
ncbi:5475_t:CDS:2 [Ambispora leptoticha]|uniref:5475_t:CDS:1 n=1 Tax=Ambispora leptoticha TaxID=144679 RepID=A0A9N9A6L8_9GLOM|nr:5475_t:CDS:2 [Ambispora leptoticha]